MGKLFDEMGFGNSVVRAPYSRIEKWLETLSISDVERAKREAENIFLFVFFPLRSPWPGLLQRRIDPVHIRLHLVRAALVDDFAAQRLA